MSSRPRRLAEEAYVGYQGLWRSSNQRHSGTAGRAIHAAARALPARCAIEVSVLITRSRPAMTAAV